MIHKLLFFSFLIFLHDLFLFSYDIYLRIEHEHIRI